MKRRHLRHGFFPTLALVLALVAGQEYSTPTASVADVGATAMNGSATANKPAVRQRTQLSPAIGGRPFSPASPWNTPTPAGTAWFDTPRLHSLTTPVNGDLNLHWWVNTDSVGIYYASNTDPVWTFDLPALNAALWHRVRPAQVFSVRAPATLIDGGDEDHVLVVVNGTTYYEVWNANVDQSRRRVTTRSAGATWAVGDIATGPGAGSAINDGTRASNFSWAAGLITGSDLQNGAIDHALVLAITVPMLKAGGTPDYVFPATAWDNGGANGLIKMGSRIGIPAATPRPAGLSPLGNMVFDALKKYGAFVGDFCGGPWPQFYADKHTVTQDQMRPLFAFWDYNGSSDMEKIQPLLRVANYQP